MWNCIISSWIWDSSSLVFVYYSSVETKENFFKISLHNLHLPRMKFLAFQQLWSWLFLQLLMHILTVQRSQREIKERIKGREKKKRHEMQFTKRFKVIWKRSTCIIALKVWATKWILLQLHFSFLLCFSDTHFMTFLHHEIIYCIFLVSSSGCD